MQCWCNAKFKKRWWWLRLVEFSWGSGDSPTHTGESIVAWIDCIMIAYLLCFALFRISLALSLSLSLFLFCFSFFVSSKHSLTCDGDSRHHSLFNFWISLPILPFVDDDDGDYNNNNNNNYYYYYYYYYCVCVCKMTMN